MNDHEDLKHNDSVASSLSTSSTKVLISKEIMSKKEESDGGQQLQQRQNQQSQFTPPDGGFQAWLVMICSFLCNGVIFGLINSYGVLFVYLKNYYKNDPDAATKASLVGSLTIGTTFLLSPISSILVDKLGIRKTAFMGGFIAFLGMLLSSFVVNRVEFLPLTYGIMFGGGSSLTYTPSLVILGHYFKKHIGLVNGFVTTGSSIFTIAMPHILKAMLSRDLDEARCLQECFWFLTGLTALQMIAALSFKPLMPTKDEEEDTKGCLPQIINVNNWKNRKYVIWSLAIPSALFGYFVPYVHIVNHVQESIGKNENGEILLTCIAVTSGAGRLIFGKIADLPKVNRILLQQISFISIGICTMLLTAAPYFHGFEFNSMIMFALIMGLFDGCFITMLGPIAYDICGPSGASQAVGFLLGLCSVPLTVGPLIAGYLFDAMGDYTLAFIIAGIPPIVGAFLMCLIYRVSNAPKDDCAQLEANVIRRDNSSTLVVSNAPSSMETESLLVKNGSSVS